MREPHDVIVRPVVTEKTAEQMDQKSLYTFIVSVDANKIEIGHAVEKLWDVNVLDVRTMRYPGTAKSGAAGRRPSFKKAIVQLAAGEHIELYEVG
jgi:large subunit ribosomal protein L23